MQKLRAECMTCKVSETSTSGAQAGARSRHLGGVFVALCDGSVHWISDDIETRFECCSVWDRLILRKDGLTLDADDIF